MRRIRWLRLLDTVERLPRSGKAATAATALPLTILPALRPGLRPGSVAAVPGAGQSPHRQVLWPPHDAVPELDARRERPLTTDRPSSSPSCGSPRSPDSRTRYMMNSVRTLRLCNQDRRNNDRPRTSIPRYDPGGNPVVDVPFF